MKKIIALLMLTTSMSLTSCSTRKVDLNVSKTVSEVKKDSLDILKKSNYK